MKIDKFASKMDNLGVLAFLYVIIYAIVSLVQEKNILTGILLIVGIGGFLVDLYVVINTYKK